MMRLSIPACHTSDQGRAYRLSVQPASFHLQDRPKGCPSQKGLKPLRHAYTVDIIPPIDGYGYAFSRALAINPNPTARLNKVAVCPVTRAVKTHCLNFGRTVCPEKTGCPFTIPLRNELPALYNHRATRQKNYQKQEPHFLKYNYIKCE